MKISVNKLVLVIFLISVLAGCAMPARKSKLISQLPTTLTSREVMFTIPAGTSFKAIQKPAYPNLTEFIIGDSDLKVIYPGNLMELEQEANRRIVKASRTGRKQGAILGIIGSMLTIVSALIAKNKLTKK